MLRVKKKSAAFYVFALIECVLSFFNFGIGLHDGCSMQDRLLYPFFHANIFHAMLNLLVLWQCIRVFPKWKSLVAFYIIAISYPLPSAHPIVGLSGLLYAYMGYLEPMVRDKIRYNLFIILYILIGFAIPNMAVGIHVYCYAVGIVWGYINAPIWRDE
nr:hypothetical protein WMHIBSEC_WMHIBSEC_CDS_0011 [Caudoviricetes sp.]CAI9751667.1 hypothetical protein AZFZUZMX_AZFZUZMX_CDS_0011 [Caudoviricetes sp.]